MPNTLGQFSRWNAVLVATIAMCGTEVRANDGDGGKEQEAQHSEIWIPLKSKLIAGIPVVEVMVGKSTGWFVLDTGSSATVFDETWARTAGLEVPQILTLSLQPSGKKTIALADLKIGEILVHVKDSWCTSLTDAGLAADERIAGVLGYEFFADRRVRIRNAVGVIDVSAATDTVIEPNSFVIPILVDREKIAITTALFIVQGGTRRAGVRTLIDTGNSTGLVISERLCTRLGIETRPEGGIATANGTTNIRNAGSNSLEVANLTIGPIETLSYNFSDTLDALVGTEALSRFDLVVDYPHGLMVFSRNGTDGGGKGGDSGASFCADTPASPPVVCQLAPESPAARAGLMNGDVVLTLNGHPFGDGSFTAFREAGRDQGKEHKAYTLGVRRGEKVLEISIDPNEPGSVGR